MSLKKKSWTISQLFFNIPIYKKVPPYPFYFLSIYAFAEIAAIAPVPAAITACRK